MPMFLGLANKDNTDAGLRAFLTRDPTKTVTPSSTDNIGIAGTAPSTSDQENIVLFGSAANTGYNSVPCTVIGAVEGTIDSSASGSMEIGTFTVGKSGIGPDCLKKTHATQWVFPSGQNGNDSGKNYSAGSSTALAFTSYYSTYFIRENGECHYQVNCNWLLVAGANSSDVEFYLPYSCYGASSTWYFGSTYMNVAGSATTDDCCGTRGNLDNAYIYDHVGDRYEDDDFTTVGDSITFSVIYKAYA
jgi:hypothetical protein